MININYTWDRKLALNSSFDIYKYELKNSNKKFIGWFFIALAQFGVVGALKHNAYGFLVVASIGLIYWYGLRWSLRKYFINRTFIKSPLANQNIQLEATNEAILSDGKTQILYNTIIKFIQLDNAIIIYHNLGTIYLPNNSFKTKKDRIDFIKYLSD